MSRNRNRNRQPRPNPPTPTALAAVQRMKVMELGPDHIGCRIEIADRFDGIPGPIAGVLVGYRPANAPQGYQPGATWRQLLIAQGPGKGAAPIVREVTDVRVVL